MRVVCSREVPCILVHAGLSIQDGSILSKCMRRIQSSTHHFVFIANSDAISSFKAIMKSIFDYFVGALEGDAEVTAEFN